MTSPLELIYEKYKHLDGPLSDTEWCTSGEGAAIYAIAGELWRAVKEARNHSEIPPSSEPNYVKVLDGSDRIWKPISVYELPKIEHAINEECVGKNDGCPAGHLKEMHDSGNETVDRVRSRKSLRLAQPEPTERDPE
jgi:hypothetical protein